MSHARRINRRRRTPSVLLESVKSIPSVVKFGPPSSLSTSCAFAQTQTPPRLQPNPSQSNHFRPPAAIPAQNRRFACPRPCVEPISISTQSKSIQPNPIKRLVSTTSGSNPFRPLKNPFSTPIYPCFHQGSPIAFQGKSRFIKANQAYFPARLPHPSLRPPSRCHSSAMCADCAQSRVPRAPSRDKCAFTCGNVRQCAVMCANFSREAFSSKNASPPPLTRVGLLLKVQRAT